MGARMDERLSRAYAEKFKEATVITITHNMEKTLGCDKILVLDGGKVREFDSPEVLMSKHNSLFYAMAKDSGLVQ